jgi:hypothetical protein
MLMISEQGAGMTRDDINKIIFDNELFHGTVGIGVVMDINHLAKFAELVAAAEREACLKLFESYETFGEDYDSYYADKYAAMIRARGQE